MAMLPGGLVIPDTSWDLRVRKKIDYAEDAGPCAEYKRDVRAFGDMLATKSFTAPDCVELPGHAVTLSYLCETGFRKPILVRQPDGLDITVPPPSFSVHDVCKILGPDFPIDVIEVASQVQHGDWTLGRWRSYYENKSQRELVMNVISLEFSGTPLAPYVSSPAVVRQLDWITTVWPPHLKAADTYPHIQYYCLMSTEGSYTDFHIDFGGTSVWYHVLKGKKRFFVIPPTDDNLRIYEEWMESTVVPRPFLGDLVSQCFEVCLEAGNTVLLPGGWIHSVHTPEDSLVFGGNFLHGLNIGMQLRVLEGEKRINLPKRFRVPGFTALLWYVAGQALQVARTPSFAAAVSAVLGLSPDPLPATDKPRFRLKVHAPTATLGYTPWEIRELPAIVAWLRASYVSWQGQLAQDDGTDTVSARVIAMEYATALCGCPSALHLLDELSGRLSGSWQSSPAPSECTVDGEGACEEEDEEELLVGGGDTDTHSHTHPLSLPVPIPVPAPAPLPKVHLKIPLTAIAPKPEPLEEPVQVEEEEEEEAMDDRSEEFSEEEDFAPDDDDGGWVPGMSKKRKATGKKHAKKAKAPKPAVATPVKVASPPKPKPVKSGTARLQDKLRALQKKKKH